MNINLRTEIIKHVLTNFSVIPSSFIDSNKTKTLNSPEYLLRETIVFEDEETGLTVNNKIWGCQLSADVQEIKVLFCDCSMDPDNLNSTQEYCLLVQLKNAPAYTLYFSFDKEYVYDYNCTIAYSVDGNGWLECTTFLQATFLAAMEQIKEVGFAWSKISNYQSQVDLLKSFLGYYPTLIDQD